MNFSNVFKTSEGASKAWAKRKAGKPSGSPTLDAVRASAVLDAPARAQYQKMTAGKGPKVIGTGKTMDGQAGTQYAVMPKSRGFTKKADITNAEMVSEGLGIKQDRKRVIGTMGMTLKACAAPAKKKPLALKSDAERMLGM